MKIKKNPKIGLVTFAAGDPIWRLAALRLAIQAKRSKRFSKISIYNKKSLLKICSEIEKQHSSEHKKGFGLWFWKPKIISDFLVVNPEIDIVVYLDAGCEFNFNNDSRLKFEQYILELEKFDSIAFQMELIEKNWSHKELSDFLNSTCEDLDSGQLVGGAHLMKRGFAIQFCAKWETTILAENFKFLIDSTNNLQIEGFKEHRHDQSIFSLLIKKENNVLIRDSLKEIYFEDFVRDGAIWPIWTSRNKSLISIKSPNHLSHMFKIIERVCSYFYRRRSMILRTSNEK
jgi:hypothetical protein